MMEFEEWLSKSICMREEFSKCSIAANQAWLAAVNETKKRCLENICKACGGIKSIDCHWCRWRQAIEGEEAE